MERVGPGLVVVADGREARLFAERRRGGPLIEVTDQLGDLSLHRPMASGFRGRGHDRIGPASHTPDERSPGERREADFVNRVGARAAEVLCRGGYEDLVLIAPPRALGQLRRAMEHAGVRVAHSEPRDRVSESPDSLQVNLRELRLRP